LAAGPGSRAGIRLCAGRALGVQMDPAVRRACLTGSNGILRLPGACRQGLDAGLEEWGRALAGEGNGRLQPAG
jgi:hypothetical protein